MRKRYSTPERGHVLAEVMVSGAVLLWAIAGVMAGIQNGKLAASQAARAQDASAMLLEKGDALRQMPLASLAALVTAAVPTVESGVDGHAQWTRTTTYASSSDSYNVGAVTFYVATVQVSYPGAPAVSTIVQRWAGF
jgi:hypothetical protein